MFCPKCGKELKEGAKFCGFCGAQIGGAPAASNVAGGGNAAPAVGNVAAAAPMAGGAGGAPAPAGVPTIPSGATKMKPARSKAPFAVAGAIALAAVVACLLVVVVKPFGASESTAIEANNMALGGGYAASYDGWDYFYSDVEQALCRAKTDGTLEVVFQVPSSGYDSPEYAISNITVDNDRLFFIKTNYRSGSAASPASLGSPGAACSMALDGSDVQTFFEGFSGSDASTTPVGLYVYDHEIHLLVCDQSDGKLAYRLLTMDEDGSDQRERCTVNVSSIIDDNNVVVTPERIIYSVNDSSSSGQTLGEVYSQNLDGTDFRQVYKSSVGYVSGIAVSGDTLIIREDNYDADKHVFTSVGMDGSGAKTVYQVPSGHSCTFLTVADEHLYIAVKTVEGTSEYQLARVSLDGGDVEAFSGMTHYYPTACVVNDHLVVSSNGGGYAMGGAQVVAVSLEGEDLATYVSLSSSAS